jgi:hypothetical protein
MTGRSPASLDVLRDAVLRQSATKSFRDLAKEIGLSSFSALARFARGETKRLSRKNHEKVAVWYYRGQTSASESPSDAQIESAIMLLRAALHDDSKSVRVRERQQREIIQRITEK